MVHRDIELARLTGAGSTSCTCRQRRSVELVRRPRPTACRSRPRRRPPPQPHRRTARRLRPVVQGQPAAAHEADMRRGPGSPTARSMPSPPTMRRTPRRPRSSRSTRRRPGCSASRPRSAWRSPTSTCRSPDVVAALSWKPAAIAGVADEHGRPIVPAGARQPRRVRSRVRRGRCSRRAGEQEPQHALRRRRAPRPGAPHALRGDRSSSTERDAMNNQQRKAWICEQRCLTRTHEFQASGVDDTRGRGDMNGRHDS